MQMQTQTISLSSQIALDLLNFALAFVHALPWALASLAYGFHRGKNYGSIYGHAGRVEPAHAHKLGDIRNP